jgi:uncharacterized coiled-coil DUF342 family protein
MDDLESIKKEVSKKTLPEPIASKPLPHEIIDLEKMIEETPKIAPLFVKIEKYKEILESIQKLKVALKNIQFLLAFKEQIKKIDAEADELLFKTAQNFSQITNEFSMNFAIPRGVRYFPKPPVEERVDTSVSDLGAKITKLREELEKIRL